MFRVLKTGLKCFCVQSKTFKFSTPNYPGIISGFFFQEFFEPCDSRISKLNFLININVFYYLNYITLILFASLFLDLKIANIIFVKCGLISLTVFYFLTLKVFSFYLYILIQYNIYIEKNYKIKI